MLALPDQPDIYIWIPRLSCELTCTWDEYLLWGLNWRILTVGWATLIPVEGLSGLVSYRLSWWKKKFAPLLTNPESSVNRYEWSSTYHQNQEVQTPKEKFGFRMNVVLNPTSGRSRSNLVLVSFSEPSTVSLDWSPKSKKQKTTVLEFFWSFQFTSELLVQWMETLSLKPFVRTK